jgi:hypothetical protein
VTLEDLEQVDGRGLRSPYHELLRPGEKPGDEATAPRYPRFFYAVPSWEVAHQILVAPRFKLSELMMVDTREAEPLLRTFPHYVPCAIVLLGHFLELLRREAAVPIYISANGGYRSPAHLRNRGVTPHSWGTAADIYRVGDTYLDDEKSITRFAEMTRSLSTGVQTRAGSDHLHVDLGFVEAMPRIGSDR